MGKQTLFTVLFAVFTAMLGVGIIIPVMPLFAEQLGATGLSLGFIVAVFSITRGFFQPVIGSWSDRWGRKGFLLTGLTIFAAVGLLIPNATAVGHLLCIRSFQGMGSAMIVPIAMAYVSSLAPSGHEGRFMGYLNVALFCGIGGGPIIGGLVSDHWGMASVFYVMAVLSSCAFLLVACFLPGTGHQEEVNSLGLFRNLKKMVRRRRTVGMLLARFSTMIMMVPTMAFLPLLINREYAGSGMEIGIIIAGRTLVNAVLQVPFGKLVDRYSKVRLLVLGCSCMGGVILLIPSGSSIMSIMVLYMLLGLGEAVIWPVLGAFATEEGRLHYGHGTMMGVFNLAMSIGVFSGAILAGVAMDFLGIAWAFYLSGAALLVVSYIGAYLISNGEDEDLDTAIDR